MHLAVLTLAPLTIAGDRAYRVDVDPQHLSFNRILVTNDTVEGTSPTSEHCFVAERYAEQTESA